MSQTFKTLCENRLQGREIIKNKEICAAKQHLLRDNNLRCKNLKMKLKGWHLNLKVSITLALES